MVKTKGGINVNLIYGNWERKIINELPVCKFVYSITNEVYRRQLLWFLWHMHLAKKESEWKLLIYWMFLWQKMYDKEVDINVNGANSFRKRDVSIASQGIEDIMKDMDIVSMKECLSGYVSKDQPKGGICISVPL